MGASARQRRCPACDARIAEAASRCHACGLGLGDANFCVQCHAIAPVYAREDQHVCCACGFARAVREGTQIATDGDILRAFEAQAQAKGRYAARAGGAALVVLLVAGLAAVVIPGHLRPFAALACLVLAVGVVSYLTFQVRREGRLHGRRRRFEIGQRVIGLAFSNDGHLTAEEVSSVLRIPRAEAGAFLQELVSTGRATVRRDSVPPVYHFGEAKPTREVRPRVEP